MIKIELDKDTIKMLEEKPKLFRQAISRGFRNGMFWIEAKAKDVFGKTGQIKAKTGHLRRSIKSKVTESKDQLVGIVGSDLIYAPVHEFGATIKAKNSPYLVFNVGGKVFGKRKAYKKVALGKEAYFKPGGIKGGNWVRVRSVTIPARPFIGPAVKLGIDEIKRQIDIEVMRSEGLNK
jgi:phage gpG-like protein